MSKETIAIVEDNLINLEMLCISFKNAGFNVLAADDGKSALARVEQSLPDLVLLDIMMPDPDGFEVCRRLKAKPETRDIPIIFLTAMTDAVDEVKGLELGAVDYIVKPFQIETVIARVKTHLSLRNMRIRLQEQNERLQQEIREHRETQEAFQKVNIELKAHIEELSILNHITQTVATVIDLQTLLDTVSEAIGWLFHAPEAGIGLFNEEQSTLTVLAHYTELDSSKEKLIGTTFSIAKDPIITQILTAQRSMVISKAQTDPVIRESAHRMLRIREMQCIMLIPLQSRGQVIGLIMVGTPRDDRTFTPGEVKLAEMVAGQIAGAIENARLFKEEQRQRQMAESLGQVATVLNSSLDQRIVLAQIFDQLARVIRYDSAGLFLQDGPHLLLSNATERARQFVGKRLRLSDGNVVAQVFHEKSPIILGNVRKSSHWQAWTGGERIRSWMGFPLLIGEKAIGVLTTDNYERDAYSQEDACVLQLFANQAAVAIHNARLFDEALHAREDAESADRAKSEFLANMSHEIRTPMHALLGFTGLLETLITDPQQQSYLEAIKASGNNLLILINDILDLSKIEAGKLDLQVEPMNLRAVLQDLTQIFQISTTEKGLGWFIETHPALPDYLLLDETRLRQVLFNLLGNAVKFTEEGFVRLVANALRLPCPCEENTCCNIQITVEDTGIGIPDSQQQLIFEAFQQQVGQKPRKYGGTGLGLAITKRLVEMMGGAITLTSEVGKGSLFEIVFRNAPVVSRGKQEEPERFYEISPIVFTQGTVLLVDDNIQNRFLLKEYLADMELQLVEAEHGEQALLLTRQYQPDVILMDLRMPVMDGYTAIKHLKNHPDSRNIPVIAVTAVAIDQDAEKIQDCGFNGYLLKPVSKAEVFRELARFLPYVIRPKGTDVSTHEVSVENVPAAILEQLPGLLEQLEQKGKGFWYKARKSGSFGAAKRLGHHLQQLGQQYPLHTLQTFGDELLKHARNFDVEQINMMLDAYPAMLKKIQSLCRK